MTRKNEKDDFDYERHEQHHTQHLWLCLLQFGARDSALGPIPSLYFFSFFHLSFSFFLSQEYELEVGMKWFYIKQINKICTFHTFKVSRI